MTPIDWIDILKLIAALVAGTFIGAEREYRSKSAGLRTIVLISVGSALFTILSAKIGFPNNPDRFAANIVTGIGFLGAGVIFKDENRVSGLTTAAIIWVSAAVGVSIGAGYYAIAITTILIVLTVQQIFMRLQNKIDSINQNRNYSITCNYQEETLHHYETVFKKFHLTVHRGKQCINNNIIKGQWQLEGSDKNHRDCVAYLLTDKSIISFEF